MSVEGGTDGRNVGCPHGGIVFSLKEEGASDTGCDMDEPEGHCAQWNKPVTEGQ